jgi:hypothetical protein
MLHLVVASGSRAISNSLSAWCSSWSPRDPSGRPVKPSVSPGADDDKLGRRGDTLENLGGVAGGNDGGHGLLKRRRRRCGSPTWSRPLRPRSGRRRCPDAAARRRRVRRLGSPPAGSPTEQEACEPAPAPAAHHDQAVRRAAREHRTGGTCRQPERQRGLGRTRIADDEVPSGPAGLGHGPRQRLPVVSRVAHTHHHTLRDMTDLPVSHDAGSRSHRRPGAEDPTKEALQPSWRPVLDRRS